MKLDRTTYEAWLLDRIEGNLTPAQERELEAFLAANPDLKVPIDELPFVADETLPFDMKAELKKSFPPTGKIDAARLNDFLVARHEGDLPGPQAMDLERYLYEHPEAAREVRLMNVSRVPDDPIAFGEKGSIERHFPPHGMPDKHRLTDFLIAGLEDDLTREQRAALEAYLLANPEARREQRLVTAARVEADRVAFPEKAHLKKKEGRVVPMWSRYAAAASIALLLGLAWWSLRDVDSTTPQFARKEQVKPVVVPQQNEGVQPQGPANETLREEDTMPQGPEAETLREKERENAKAPLPQQVRPPSEEHVPMEEPRLANRPAEPAQEPLPEPLLSHERPQHQQPAPEEHPVANVQGEEPTLAANGQPVLGGSTIGTLLANTVRNEVLETRERTTGLDRNDALAMVDKGLNAITGGEGGVQVQHTGTRDRWKLRLGRGLAISASRGR